MTIPQLLIRLKPIAKAGQVCLWRLAQNWQGSHNCTSPGCTQCAEEQVRVRGVAIDKIKARFNKDQTRMIKQIKIEKYQKQQKEIKAYLNAYWAKVNKKAAMNAMNAMENNIAMKVMKQKAAMKAMKKKTAMKAVKVMKKKAAMKVMKKKAAMKVMKKEPAMKVQKANVAAKAMN